jgi:hypothetical protein
MDNLRAAILEHTQLRTVTCCLCGVSWEEQLVGVALVAGKEVLGDLCPRCLSHEPATAAARLRMLWGELQNCGFGEGPEPPAADMGGRIARLQREGDRLRSLALQIHALNAESPQATDDLVSFAEQVKGMGHWDLAVEQVVAAERLSFLRCFGPLHDQVLRREVDDRYRDFIAASA